MRILLAVLVVPLLLAPVRLKDSTPAFFTPPGQSPAPESYSLPAAAPLTTPTVVFVSPTVVTPASPTQPVSQSLNLPLPVSPSLPSSTITPQPQASPTPNLMSPTAAALCQRSLLLVRDIGMLSYGQKRNRAVLKLALAASTALPEVQARQWPTLNAFISAEDDLPWFQPQGDELEDAATAALSLCRPS